MHNNSVSIKFFLLACVVLVSTVQCNLGERFVFAKEFFKSPGGVGTVFPCSQSVGAELVKYIVKSQQSNPSKPLRILEVGAGTGSITEVIASSLRSIDCLDAVELSEDMSVVLHKKFDSKSNISVHCISILDWSPQYHYDFIISTLPFTLFDIDMMVNAIEHLKKLIKPYGVLSFVAYLGGSTLKSFFAFGGQGREQRKKSAILKNLRGTYEIGSTVVWKNVPPINVYHLQIH